MKRTFSLVVSLSLTTILYGCGGGAGGFTTTGSASTSSKEQLQTFGSLTTRVVGSAQAPVTSAGSGVAVTGIAGGSVTAISIDDKAPSLGETEYLFTRADASGFLHVFAVRPDGTGLRQITFGIGSDYDPCWSPDRTKVAYGHQENGFSIKGLYVCNVDGTGAHKIFSDDALVRDVAWSPDGSKIAFTRLSTGLSHSSLGIVNADGTGLIPVATTHRYDQHACWSPDSSHIVFDGREPNFNGSQIYEVSSDGTGFGPVTGMQTGISDQFRAWSPDGSTIAFERADALGQYYIMLTSDGFLKTLLTTTDYLPERLCWSPDGSKLVFERIEPDSHHLSTISADGTTQSVVTNGVHDQSPRWSPFVTKRNLVGPGGPLGTSAAGFLFARSGDIIRSVLTFDTPPDVRSTARLTAETPSNPMNGVNVSFSLNATNITSLRFAQNPTWFPTTVIPNAATPSIVGAVIDYDAIGGEITAVLPYSSTRASSAKSTRIENGIRIHTGHFLGVWDASGKNQAPNGAWEVRTELKTGRILSIK